MILMPNSLAEESERGALRCERTPRKLIRTKASLDSPKPDCIVATLRRTVAQMINKCRWHRPKARALS
jgi:hypothetical protein